ncbi:MAG: nitrate- and nitrite sensing domain-containing protein [Micromonosporaceae bacterium]|nr:nitrate- and nitrite sensing domain-containing protein [Micromonosporaceae bacterium]
MPGDLSSVPVDQPVAGVRALPLWRRVSLIMVIPVTVVLTVAAMSLVRIAGSAETGSSGRLAALAADGAALVHELQHERSLAVFVLDGLESDAQAAFEQQAKTTAEQAERYQKRQRATADSGVPGAMRDRFERITVAIDDLPRMQERIATGQKLAMSIAVSRYGTLINDLLGLRAEAAEKPADEGLRKRLRAVAAVSTLKESVSAERVVMLSVLARGVLTSVDRKDYQMALFKQTQASETFTSTATSWQREQYDELMIGPDLREAFKLRGIIESWLESAPGTETQLPSNLLDPQRWNSALAGKSDALRNVEVKLDENLAPEATS